MFAVFQTFIYLLHIIRGPLFFYNLFPHPKNVVMASGGTSYLFDKGIQISKIIFVFLFVVLIIGCPCLAIRLGLFNTALFSLNKKVIK